MRLPHVATGYDKGKSDAVKQQYWLYVSMQKERNQISSVRLYPVAIAQTADSRGDVPAIHKASPHRGVMLATRVCHEMRLYVIGLVAMDSRVTSIASVFQSMAYFHLTYQLVGVLWSTNEQLYGT